MKMIHIVQLTQTFPALLDAKLPVAISLRVLRIKDEIMKEAEIYNNALAALKEKHKDDAEAFDKEYRELLDQDSELVIEKIPVSELGDLHLTPAELDGLREVIDI